MNFTLSRVFRVGLAAAFLVFWSIATGRPSNDAALEPWRAAGEASRTHVIRLARAAFDHYVVKKEVMQAPKTSLPLLRQRIGVFVSTMRFGAPRCCMGTIYPTEPDAAHEIIASATAAAGRDRRFPAIKPAELSHLTLIVSIVGAPRAISEEDLSRLDPTRDGLVVRHDDRVGVILPGETSSLEKMLAWGKKRAGLTPGSKVELFRIDAVRWIEQKK